MTSKTKLRIGIWFVILIGVLGLIWWLLQPPAIERGDRRWCGQIASKPTETWTRDDVLGYAQENCMQWHFLEDRDTQRTLQD